jgi:GalNAc-alpha-(1->4)-GalNAc-alpha-(1->3)-diNAcBac-PP-undecaprenol alpha-1,4-N-acetyl-D-galactosaminyltransferase
MNILLVIGSLGGGGAEKVMVWLAERLAQSGHDVSLATQLDTSTDKYTCPASVRHFSFGGSKRYLNSSKVSAVVNQFRWGRFLWRIRRETRPDVVVSFIDSMNINVLLTFLLLPQRVVVCERTDPAVSPLSRNRKWLRPWLYRHRAATVVFQTPAIATRFEREWHLSGSCVIPNAVTAGFLVQSDAPRGKVVVSVGRLDPLKGHDTLLEAWALLGKAREKWRLRIVGEGPLRSAYEARIAELGVASSVELPGFTSNVVQELQRASIGVLPSRVEGFPNALIEMMAVGLPVIASDLPPACSEIVSHDSNGLLFSGNSAQALAEALERLITQDETRIRLGRAAGEVRTRYSEAACLSAWEDCLRKAVR